MRAARGFNGGIVSVHHRTWTTDRAAAVRLWDDPADSESLSRLLGWAQGTLIADSGELVTALAPGGIVAAVAARFADEIGLRP